MRKNAAACPARGNVWWGRPERESRTPVNIANRRYGDNGEGVAKGHPLTLCVSRSVREPVEWT
jgi:hypothetical protein